MFDQPEPSFSWWDYRRMAFRRNHGLNVVSLWRRNEPIEEGLAYTPLEIGDFLLVSGAPPMIRRFPS